MTATDSQHYFPFLVDHWRLLLTLLVATTALVWPDYLCQPDDTHAARVNGGLRLLFSVMPPHPYPALRDIRRG